MEDRSKEIVEAAVDYVFDHFVIEMSPDSLGELLTEAQQLRIDFAKSIGLPLDENLRCKFEPATVDREVAKEYQALASRILRRDISIEEAILNRLRDGSKLSRKIMRRLEALNKFKPHNAAQIGQRIQEYLQLLTPPDENVVNYLSTNILDILQASYNCSYSSCFRPGGEYELAPVILTAFPRTLIAFGHKVTYKSIYKVWRCWVMLCADNTFQIGRLYGNPLDTEIRGLRRFIELLLDNKAGHMRLWTSTKQEPSFITQNREYDKVYYDDVTTWYVKGSKIKHDLSKKAYRIADSFIDAIYKDNYIAQCDHCGEAIFEGEGYASDAHIIVCDVCYENYYGVCSQCRQFYLQNTLSNTDGGEDICDHCAAKYEICDSCDAVIVSDYIYHTDEGETLCDECAYSLNAPECHDCCVLITQEINKIEIDGQIYCPNCAERIKEVENAIN